MLCFDLFPKSPAPWPHGGALAHHQCHWLTAWGEHGRQHVCNLAVFNNIIIYDWFNLSSSSSLNEYGTMRTLNGLRDPKYRMYEVNPGPANTRGLKHNGAIHVTENVFLQRPLEAGNPNILLRTKADQFDVTPAGGLFKSSVDPNISVYFPVKAIPEPLTITMQVGQLIL